MDLFRAINHSFAISSIDIFGAEAIKKQAAACF
jgi:hypothetical protein